MVYTTRIWPQSCLAFAHWFVLLQHCSYVVVQKFTEFFHIRLIALSLGSASGQPNSFLEQVYCYSFSTHLTQVLFSPYPTIQHNHHGMHTFSSVIHQFIHYVICPCGLSIPMFSYTLLCFSLRALSVTRLKRGLPFLTNERSPAPTHWAAFRVLRGTFRWLWVIPACKRMLYKYFPLPLPTTRRVTVLCSSCSYPPSASPACLFAQYSFHPYPYLLHHAIEVSGR